MPLESNQTSTTTKTRLSSRMCDRHVSFSYADDAADDPDAVHVAVMVGAHRQQGQGLHAPFPLAKSSLSAQEQETLEQLLGKLVSGVLAEHGYTEK